MTDEQLREAFRDPTGSVGTCDEDRIWAGARGRLSPEELSEVLAHLRACGACADAWALAREAHLAMTEEMPSSQTVEEPLPPAANRQWWWGALAVAAVLVMVGLVVLGTPAPEGVDPVLRGEEAGLEGGILEGRVLSWAPVEEATRYEVAVLSPDLTVLFEGTVDEPRVVLPSEVGSGEVLWRVTAHLADGSTQSSATFSAVIPEE